MNAKSAKRVLSGMRSTGQMHLGHYYGVLKNWLKLQTQYDCFFFAADWHALTTEYENPGDITKNTWEMIVDWLAAGVDPARAHIFIQSRIPAHAELHLLLSMMTPLGWLERVPTYKDQQQQLKDKDLSTYGFLGYPVLQAADILAYKADGVPVGEDQLPHLELVRKIARRFNYLYGRAPEDRARLQDVLDKINPKNAELFHTLTKRYQEKGSKEVLDEALALIETLSPSENDRAALKGYLEGSGRIILPEPEALLTETPMFPGLDGRKMSKSYQNIIGLREEPASVEQKIKTMSTDPARVRRTDPGNPDKCPVWNLHKIYSDDETKDWVQIGCKKAGIGCLECKKPLIDRIIEEQKPIRERAQKFVKNPKLVHDIVDEGCKKARKIADETLKEVHEAMGI